MRLGVRAPVPVCVWLGDVDADWLGDADPVPDGVLDCEDDGDGVGVALLVRVAEGVWERERERVTEAVLVCVRV